MKRHFIDKFHNWLTLSDEKRKPLIIRGQRQIGKTYFIKKLLTNYIGNVIALDFIENKNFNSIFATNNSPKEIIKKIELELAVKIDLNRDLLFLDEIQECSEAIQSLKYFYEQLPQIKVVAAGSYLGIAKNESSFPVGKVQFLSMGQLSFAEFTEQLSTELYEVYKTIDPFSIEPIDPYYHQKLLGIYNRYLAVGGMPEVVSTFIEHHKTDEYLALQKAREIQLDLLTGYKADFSKHAGINNSSHILHVFDSIPAQLMKLHNENCNRYRFNDVIPNNKGFNKIIGPLSWLEESRLVIKTFICNKAIDPLKGYTHDNQFKLFYTDIGLLQANLKVPINKIVSEELGSYKGYIAENFVASELFLNLFDSLYSWAEGSAQLEFLIHLNDNEITPIEVKSSANYLRAKSLDSYIQKYHPKRAIKLVPVNRGYNKDKKIHSIPIYLAGKLHR